MKNLDHVMMDDSTSSFNVKWSNYVTQPVTVPIVCNTKQTKHVDVTDWYQEETQKTAVYPRSIEIDYLFNALASEVGEACGKAAKFLRDQDYLFEVYKRDVKAELGDVLWNISQLCNYYGWKLSDVMRENIDKLRDRAKRGVIHGSGDNR